MRILLIEDDHILGQAVRDRIIADGHAVDWCKRLDEAGNALAVGEFGLVLLDLMLPDGLGIPFLTKLRRSGNKTPVIILTALGQISDRIDGLNAGADDYLVKPFDLDELGARIAAVGRRYDGNPNPIQKIAGLEIDRARHKIMANGRNLTLTAREWALLDALLERPGQIRSRAALESQLYSFDDEIGSNTIEVHISRLRRKLGKEAIVTERGLGYRMGQEL